MLLFAYCVLDMDANNCDENVSEEEPEVRVFQLLLEDHLFTNHVIVVII